MGGVSRSPRRRLPLLAVAAACAVAALGAPTAHAYEVTTLTGFLLPRSAAISPDGSTAYVTNEMGNTVAVVDLGRREQTATIPVGTAPSGVAFAPSGTRAYVTLAPSHLQAIDTATATTVGGPIQTARTGYTGAPEGIAITADGRWAFVANFGSSGVGAVDLVTGQFEADIVSGGAMGQPSAIVVHGSETRVYTNGLGPNLLWEALPLDNVTSPFTVAPFALSGENALALSPDGSHLYATSSGNDSVLVADTANRRVIADYDLPAGAMPYGIAISPSGNRLYVTCAGNGGSIAVLDPATGQSLDTIALGGAEPWNVAITPDGSRLISANSTQDSVTIVQVTPDAPTGLSASASDTTATVSFTAPAANGTPITGYQYALNGGAWSTTTPATTASPLVVGGLTPGTAYAIRVRATDARGPGAVSAPVAVTTQSPAATTATRGAGITATKPRVLTATDGSVALRTTVTTSGPGRIRQTATSPSGKAKAVTRCTARATVKKAGEHVIACRLNAKARAALRTARLVLTVTTTFTATGATTGTSTTDRVVVPRRR